MQAEPLPPPIPRPSLAYDTPLSPGEIRRQHTTEGVRILVGPRTSGEVVASFQWQLICLAVITGGALALSGAYAVRLLLYGARARDFEDAIGGVGVSAAVAALLGGILLHQYRRRTRPTLFLIDDTSFSVDPEDERYMWIGVPRGQVAGVEAVRLRGRAFARRPGALKVHLHGAPPLVALSGSDLAVVERVAAELRSVLSATGAAPTPVAPLRSDPRPREIS